MLLTKLGPTIQKLRKEACLTQDEFSEKTNLNRTYISKFERGNENISIKSLLKIANALDIPLSKLINLAEEANHAQN